MQMRVTAAGLVLLALAHEAIASGCPIIVPAGAWPQGAVHEAVSAGKPDVTVPLKHEGFNRTVTIDGLCADAFTISSSFICSGAGGEFRAGLTTAPALSPVALRFGKASCPLTAISVYKTAAGSKFEAEMRFHFEGCVGAPVTSAAVVVGIRPDEKADFNLLPWTKEVCKVPGQTTPSPVATISAETDAVIQLVGAGTCVGTVRREIEKITTEQACKFQCVSSLTKAHLLGGTGCRGFSFNDKAAGATCITYSGNITASQPKKDWQCYNMSFNGTGYAKSTPPPVPVSDTTELLDLKKVLGTSSVGYLQHISPPLDAPACFLPMWWFTLEDQMGQPQSVPIKQSEWDEFKTLLPAPMPTVSVVSAPQVIDRVIVNTCSVSKGWGAQACFVPVAKKTECRDEEITGAIVSGVITSLLTWLLVGVVFYVYKKTLMGKAGYESLAEAGGRGGRFCQSKILCCLCVVAAGGACICCWLSMQFLNAVLNSSGCYDFDEFLVVILAVTLATALTIIVILQYMASVHPSHPHPLLAPEKKVERKTTKLVLVEVEDGKNVGMPLDTLTGQSEGSVFTSFASNNGGQGSVGMNSSMAVR